MSDNKYYLFARKVRVPVSYEVYKAYYRELETEKYISKRARQYEVLTDNASAESGIMAGCHGGDIEELLIQDEQRRRLHRALAKLSEYEYELIDDLYFKGYSERNAASKRGIHHMTLHSQKQSVLDKLNKYLKN